VPLAIFGSVGYGLRSGILGGPARATQAASPLLFGLLMDRMGIGVLAISAGLSLSALVAPLLLKARPVPCAGGGIAKQSAVQTAAASSVWKIQRCQMLRGRKRPRL